MDGALYESIVSDLNSCKLPHVNDNIITFLQSKYKGLSTETLRSIIGLWYTRRIAALSSRVKDVNIYKMYKELVNSGNTTACFSIAGKTGYPPALIAKIVLTSYLSENQKNKPKVDPKKAKELRKPLCCYCIDRKNKLNSNMDFINEEVSLIKKHNDPRIELALNLFDEQDEIGQYFLEKFKYSHGSNNTSFTKEGAKNKSNKFYWQASTFEQMGEKNVMKFKNIERLFANPNPFEERSDELAKSIDNANNILQTRSMSNTDKPTTLIRKEKESPRRGSTSSFQKRASFKIKDLLRNFDDINIENADKENLTSQPIHPVPEEYPPEYPPSPENDRRCVCSALSSSDDSDSDSDTEEAWENVNVRELLENTSLIEDPILAQDVLLCTISDDQYGPTSDIISNSLGVMYERILEDHVKNAGLPYRTENKLRGVGVDKTPDIILLVPVAVDGFVINWIESKALFADYKQHQCFKKNQFKNYTNRFGPGFVIYWHGYVDDIPELYLAKKEIIVRDRFPPKESFTFVKSDKFKSWMQSS